MNTWSHLAATYDGIDGAALRQRRDRRHQQVCWKHPRFHGPLSLGANVSGNSIWPEWFRGELDDVRVYSRARSANEIQSDMDTAVASRPRRTALQTRRPRRLRLVFGRSADAHGAHPQLETATDNVGVTG